MKVASKIASIAVASALVLGSQLSFAGAPTINGTVVQNTNANNTFAVSIGRNSVAKNRIGAINANVNGTAVQNTNANNTFAVSIGRNSTSCNEVGVLGGSDCKGK
jgi:hypothetical protein